MRKAKALKLLVMESLSSGCSKPLQLDNGFVQTPNYTSSSRSFRNTFHESVNSVITNDQALFKNWKPFMQANIFQLHYFC